MMNKIDRWAWVWLVAGILLTVGAEMRWGIGALAWIAPVPFLRYLRVTKGWKSQLLFMAAMLTAWTLVVFKIVTEPVPAALAPGFGLVMALFLGVPYLGWNVLRRMGGDRLLTVLGFAGLMVIAEWLQHSATPFGSWGAAAYTQVEHLALLQVASLVGMAGVSFLIYLVAGALELALARGLAVARTPLIVAGASVAVALVFGGLRLANSGTVHEETALVAAVGTDLLIAPGKALPTDEELQAVEDALVRRTIAGQLSGGAPTTTVVAGKLGIGAKTLQRRLKAEGVTFAEVLDEVRLDWARLYLGDPAIGLAEISWLLGFSEQSAFSRAFKRGTGRSPTAWRRESAQPD